MNLETDYLVIGSAAQLSCHEPEHSHVIVVTKGDERMQYELCQGHLPTTLTRTRSRSTVM